MIQQSTRRCDDNIRTFAKLRNLCVDAHAAVNHSGSERQEFTIGAHALRNLRCQFACRGEYQRTDASAIDGAVLQAMQHWQGKACGLAGTRLGPGQHIAAFENARNCLLLNRSCGFVALLFDGAQQFGRKAKFVE